MSVWRFIANFFFNNVVGFVSQAFPVLKSIYGDQAWRDLVDTFFKQHDCHSPIFIDIAEEFLHYLQHEYVIQASDPDYMLELAHYEWLELVVSTQFSDPLLQNITLLDEETVLLLESSSQVAQYQFPVHQISEDHQDVEISETGYFFCIYRDADDNVQFMQLNPMSAQVLAYIQQSSQTSTKQLLAWLVKTYPDFPPQSMVDGCLTMLSQFSQKGIIKTTAK
ncbi:HvfC family RiPP maturation protein [Shewanella marina]|uniref:HvfC family RiPP maturation protein n=1 Tax=Shewanella marina TaxID=487319 RepID=UPI000A5A304B|nr:putative DNA-binding domain-containing protein [Shewanella marina]